MRDELGANMNDPGLHEPISEDAKDLENQDRDEQDAQKEDEEAFLEPKYEHLHLRQSKTMRGA